MRRMPSILIQMAACTLRMWPIAIVVGWLCLFAPTGANAAFCSNTNCELQLTNSNFLGQGNFGTVTLSLASNVVTVNVNLGSGYRIITTGFPGAFGFMDSLGGGLTIGNFKTGGIATSLYSGFSSKSPGCTGKPCHWDGFGYANNAAATNGPKRGDSLQQLSFTVSKLDSHGFLTSITDIHKLLNLFSPEGGQGPAYFVVDACRWVNGSCSGTGLFGVTQVPEPASIVLLVSALVSLGIWRRKKYRWPEQSCDAMCDSIPACGRSKSA